VVVKKPVSIDSAETEPEVKEPEVVSYLQYIGYAVGSLGEETHFVKNMETGQVVPLRMDAVYDGWKLVEVSETGILVQRDERLYQISDAKE
jgi:hypothetical protein